MVMGPKARPLDPPASIFKDDESVTTGHPVKTTTPMKVKVRKPPKRFDTQINLVKHVAKAPGHLALPNDENSLEDDSSNSMNEP